GQRGVGRVVEEVVPAVLAAGGDGGVQLVGEAGGVALERAVLALAGLAGMAARDELIRVAGRQGGLRLDEVAPVGRSGVAAGNGRAIGKVPEMEEEVRAG